MGLEVPDLDDRTFDELLTDVRKRIAVHSDDWTDHNATDPGITMLEVLAWVAESDIYELDRVTERHVRKYLRLLGVQPRKPRTATVSLSVDPPTAATGKVLWANTGLTAEHAGRTEAFRTTHDVVLTDAAVAAVVSKTAAGRVDNTPANDGDGLYFLAFGQDAVEDSAVYVGFDADPFEGGTRLDLYVDFHESNLPEPASHGDHAASFTPSVQVVWEYCTDYNAVHDPDNWQRVDGDDDSEATGDSDTQPNEGVIDGTDQLYHGGTVSIPVPANWPEDPPTAALFDTDQSLYWLRARIDEAGHEVPPQINALETRVVEARHRTRRTGVRLDRISDGMTVETVRSNDTGPTTTTAQPAQEFVFPAAPVQDAVVTVGGEVWTEVDDFDASGPDSTDYVIDHERGVVRFGDGIRGEVPVPGQIVEATWYEHGGGEAGNVPPSANWQLVGSQPASPQTADSQPADSQPADSQPADSQPANSQPANSQPANSQTAESEAVGGQTDDERIDDALRSDVDVTARGPATGGASAESMDAALARLKADLRTPYRGVTKPDYRYLATHTPGLRFGRAAVHVETGDGTGAGCSEREAVIVVVPYSPPHRTRPVPSEGFLDAVACHLERHRLLTDQVTVEAPTYVGVQVETVIEVEPGSSASHTVDAVEQHLSRFLDPLEGFGGDGWPFGRPVYRSELYEAVESVDGVDCVRDVDLSAQKPGTRIDAGIGVPKTALVDLEAAVVTVAGTDEQCGAWSR